MIKKAVMFIRKKITTEIAGIRLNYFTFKISDEDTCKEFDSHTI